MGFQRIWLYGLIPFLLSVLYTFTFGGVSAQTNMENSPLTYEELVIKVLPQYVNPEGWEDERPAVLVGQHGTLKNEGESSYNGEIRIPVSSDNQTFKVSMVGMFDEQGVVHDVEASVDKETQEVVWEIEEALDSNAHYQYVIEYFIDPYDLSEDTYTFSYHYELERRADDLTIMIFEPFGSEEFTLSQEPDQELEMYGVIAHIFEEEMASEGEAFTFVISYEKADRLTTLEALESQVVPNDEIHAQFQTDDTSELATNGTRPLIDLEGAIMISTALIIASLFVFFGLKSRIKYPTEIAKPLNSKESEAEKIRALRQQLIRGEINEETYNKARKERLGKGDEK
ncbi:hypothetical protein MM221_08805 [Salipaludibacillus sp. LMS25]|jgi:hypothetical protein|uniref:hypothetical protein n=1 Tax=Salipaludibacillus sp. LMS25 TaxID=2924031 RepID=UPI0020CFEF14|nr:hypothetical protein [Salipaludibacillus sp. LMS25]UTR16608.1 hypothetical protein MM221_08805 [Salipaludibacillus sp. LMS25]